MPFYSQYSEDSLLFVIFPHQNGLCVEVGANDGITFSNTKYFEEIGWTCILVEPAPELCRKIRQSRTGHLFECAASSSVGELVLHIADGHDLFSSLEAQSTMADELGKLDAVIRSVTVKVRPLDDMLAEAGAQAVDFISIDVEGHEMSVLHGFTLSRWRPRVILIEDKSDLSVTAVEKHLNSNGYCRFYRSGGNDWYAAPGTISAGFMLAKLFSGRIGIRGLLKVWLPRPFMRRLLQAKRGLR